ncbi:hypothetical protein N7539_005554 [Penicillium diatomitis]|uniref:Major facilitator superfamily (MFS) profile domain-containing protein n=1 Tax=Penicillium diatomitis TaxID=2819901 RepID=A0A9X0BV63_9EURO|nr:uncharacterized protein N7539_005554 [Penicillium diatomitis]KAJ5485566.1 hypothetical protein N7539_005554 [Penicillium diatomitis]
MAKENIPCETVVLPDLEISAEPIEKGGASATIRGCAQVLGAFFVCFNVWGLNFAFGSFQSFYALTFIPSTTASAISWIGTIQSWLLIAAGLISGPLFDMGFFRSMVVIGTFFSVLGFMMLSLSHEYYAIFLSQGVTMGLGFGLLYVPTVALISRRFSRNRAVALGVATSGAPAGGIIYTLIFNQLIVGMGFAWTVRIMAFIMLALFVLAGLLLASEANLPTNQSADQRRRLFDNRALRDLPFWSFTASNFLIYLGYITPYYYIPTFAQTQLHASRSTGSYILMGSQAASIVGRVLTTVFAHRFGSMISWVICCILSGILCLAWISADSILRFVLFVAFYGAISGALVPLPPSVFPHVCPYPESLGTWLGMAQSISGFASLIGPPIAGALASINSKGSADLNFLGIQLFSGITMTVGAFSLLLLWYLLYSQRGKTGLF